MVTPCDCALSGLRAVPKTVNPRPASSRAVAWPMPDDAPVTKIVCDMNSPKDGGALCGEAAYYPYDMSLAFTRLPTPIGELVLPAPDTALTGLHFPTWRRVPAP